MPPKQTVMMVTMTFLRHQVSELSKIIAKLEKIIAKNEDKQNAKKRKQNENGGPSWMRDVEDRATAVPRVCS